MEKMQDPHQYLETESRIIAENDTHVAIALRVEKADIVRHLSLMAALTDCISSAIPSLAPNKII